MAQDKENRKSTRHFDLQKGSTRKFELEKDSIVPIPPKLEVLKKELLADGIIDAEEVKKLRKELYADGVIDKEEAELLFEINDEVSGKANDVSWQTFFVEAISDFLLKDEKSPNVIDEDEGAWLVEKIGNDGKVDSTEKALLVNLQKKAKSIPDGVKNLIKSAKIAGANLTSSTNVQQEDGGENPSDGGNSSGSKKWLWIIAIIIIILLAVFLLARNKKESSSVPNVPDTTNVSKDSLNHDSTPAATPKSTNKQESPNSNAQNSSTINNDNASQASSAGNQSAKPAMTNNSPAGEQADNSIAPAGEKLASFGLGSTACGNTKSLARLARKLRKSGGKVSIYGYADKTGTYKANQIISQRRADAVKSYLINHGVRSEQINAVGKGVSVKYPTNAQNRRVEAVVE